MPPRVYKLVTPVAARDGFAVSVQVVREPGAEIAPTIYAGRKRTGCGRCGMSFVIGSPAHSDAERFRCPDCRRSFWNAKIANLNIVVCGVECDPASPPAEGRQPSCAGPAAVPPLPGRAAVRSLTREETETLDAALFKSMEIIDEGHLEEGSCCALDRHAPEHADGESTCPAPGRPT